MQAAEYPYQYPVEVIFHHLDAMGHVNNVTFFMFLETARIKYVSHLWATPNIMDAPIILAQANCTYVAPAFLGENLVVGVGVTRLGNKSFDLAYRIDADNGRHIATAHTTQVTYNYHTQQTIPIPNLLRQRIEEFQQGWCLEESG
ncbi:MAG: acyl-CoA thioesterase [Ardenticatenaceae bacterium]|nr:acyl-CoA thioesterase [Ardenticatenaceae bacterium]